MPSTFTTRTALLVVGPVAAVLPVARALTLGVDGTQVLLAAAAATLAVVVPLAAAAHLDRRTGDGPMLGCLLAARGRRAQAVLGAGSLLVGWQLTSTDGGATLEFGLVAALVTLVAARHPHGPDTRAT